MKNYNHTIVKKVILLSLVLLCSFNALAQMKWYNPLETDYPVIQNQSWVGEKRASAYDRMPLRAKDIVPGGVNYLQQHTAGECISFTTNAKLIRMRYSVPAPFSMEHMPSTGVSGLDVYTRTRDGKSIRVSGEYSFSDTCMYEAGFKNFPIEFDSHGKYPHTFTVYLPLYNTVKWLEIGVDSSAYFHFEPLRQDKPIVVYGSSIAQGACASRPGMAWTNILHRNLDRPVVNLGFSGAAYFEKGVIDMLSEIDAKVYVLDAIPNSVEISPEKVLTDTIVKAVHKLHADHPNTPILLVDNYNLSDGEALPQKKVLYDHANNAQRVAYEQLIGEGVTGLYYLSHDELEMPADGIIEGTHPSDLGQQAYAVAYEKKLREILREPIGERCTETPVQQSRDGYNWISRHNQVIAWGQKQKHYERVIIGNSIVHYWGGQPGSPYKNGGNVWNQYLKGTLNMGFGWDRIENVLWRIYHDELDAFTADNIYLMIGTNNLESGLGSNEDIVYGIERLVKAIRVRRPEAKLTLIGILPRRNMEQRVRKLNVAIANMATSIGVSFRNPGIKLLKADGKIDESNFLEGLHPNGKGYEKIVSAFVD